MISLAAVLAILMAIGPVLELDAAALHIFTPQIQQLLKEHQKMNPRGRVFRGVSRPPPSDTCYHFRCP